MTPTIPDVSRAIAVRAAPSDLLLLAAAGIGLAVVGGDGMYRPHSVAVVTAATVVAMVGLGRRRAGDSGAAGLVGLSAFLAVAAGAAWLVPAGLYGTGPALVVSRAFTVVAALTALVAVAGAAGRAGPDLVRTLAALVVAVAVGASVSMIVSSPHPAIDVWSMYQAAGHALLHGHNPYLVRWTSGLIGEVSNQFTYLPGSAVLLAPWYAVFGDVRYGLVAALLVTAWLAHRLGGRRGPLLAMAVMLFPGGTFATEQSWNDPLLMATLAGTVYATRRGRTGWAVACFAAALTCKQYVWLLVPLAAVWGPFGWRRTGRAVLAAAVFVLPWFLAAPGAFYSGVVRYNLELPPRRDSLSLYALAVRHGVTPGMGLVALFTVGAVVLAAVVVRRRPPLFLAAAGLVMAAFDLVNKQSFFNEWELAAVLLVLGAAELMAGAGVGAGGRSGGGAQVGPATEEPGKVDQAPPRVKLPD